MTRWLKFSEQLRQAMDELGINQSQLVGMTGKSKEEQRNIAEIQATHPM